MCEMGFYAVYCLLQPCTLLAVEVHCPYFFGRVSCLSYIAELGAPIFLYMPILQEEGLSSNDWNKNRLLDSARMHCSL